MVTLTIDHDCEKVQGESKKMSPLTKYDTIAPNVEINEIHFRDIDPDVHTDSRYKIVLIGQEMYELSAPENEGRVLLQHKFSL